LKGKQNLDQLKKKTLPQELSQGQSKASDTENNLVKCVVFTFSGLSVKIPNLSALSDQ